MNVLEQWFEDVWNKRNAAAIDEFWVPEKVVNGLNRHNGEKVATKDEFKAFRKSLLEAFPDMHIAVEDTFSAGDKVVARLLVTGRHTGLGLHLPPTGKPVRYTGIAIVRVKDGKVVESWNNFDFMTMYHQLSN
jgi:steroid delta-isomerase-like uncharacterized protein